MLAGSSFVRVISGLFLCIPLAACDDGLEGDASDVALASAPSVSDVASLRGLDHEFAEAAADFDVPVEILQGLSYAETRWQMVEGEAEFEGQEPAFGVMALRGARLQAGARLVGASVDDVKFDRDTNIRAAAALLSQYADEHGIERDALGAWAPAVAASSNIQSEEALANYIHRDVYGSIRDGVEVADADGRIVAKLSPRHSVAPAFAASSTPASSQGADYPSAIWRPSPNYSKGNGDPAKMVIIHTCEGGYAGCWSWLSNPQAGASAHYVVKEDGTEITQLVSEAERSWHIAAAYECANNGGVNCDLNGIANNSMTIGIEHAGFASQATWDPNLIEASAKLTCAITRAHGIPRDKFHIVGHGQLQPWDRTDPGVDWPWATYINKVQKHCSDDPTDGNDPQPDPEIVIDNDAANNDAAKARVVAPPSWFESSETAGYYGNGYRYADTAQSDDGIEFWFHLDRPGVRTIDAWWTAGDNRTPSAPFVMFNSAGAVVGTVHADQQKNGAQWVTLGTFNFKAGWNKVMLSRWAEPGFVVMADAIRVR